MISLSWRDKNTRILIFEVYVRSVLLYRCSIWGVKFDGRGRVGIDCTGELGTFYQSFLISVLNVGHTTRKSILYMLFVKPPL